MLGFSEFGGTAYDPIQPKKTWRDRWQAPESSHELSWKQRRVQLGLEIQCFVDSWNMKNRSTVYESPSSRKTGG